MSVLLGLVLVVATVGRQLNRTALNADFVADELEKVDFVGLATAHVVASLDNETHDFWPPIEASLLANRAKISAEIRRVLQTSFTYFKGESTHLEFTVPLRPYVQDFRQRFRDYLRENPPAEIRSLPVAEQEKARRDIENGFINNLGLPANYVFNSAKAAPDMVADLRRIRDVFGAVELGSTISLAAVILFAAALVLVGSWRWLAVVLVGHGALVYLMASLSDGTSMAAFLTEIFSLPKIAEQHLPRLYREFVGPMAEVGLISLVVGATILLVTFFVKRERKNSVAVT
ncbi:hypothetical protein [Oleiharenicola lentus]|uniref:hypothetical protein n=1 Tax=Oleiharenicola lentus TaxID=2508720 RepID=UPI003F67AB54